MSVHDGVQFKGYATNNLPGAIAAYLKAIRVAPTLAVVRPDFKLIGENEIVIRSRHGAAGVILLTHYSTPQDWNEGTGEVPMRPRAIEEYEKIEGAIPSIVKKKSYSSAKKYRGKPGSCPHCTQHIADFNKLGFWYGWAMGMYPPYWDELRLFVFRRDNFTCTACGARLSSTQLQAHHIVPKEDGGTDSARNLTSLCGLCHKDPYPMMPTEEEAMGVELSPTPLLPTH